MGFNSAPEFHASDGTGAGTIVGINSAANSPNLILVYVEGTDTGSPMVAPTDGPGNTYLPCGPTRSSSFAGAGRLFYCDNPTLSGSHSWNTSVGLPSIIVNGWKTAASAPSLDVEDGTAGVSSPGHANAGITPSNAGSLLIFALGGAADGSASPSGGGGYTVSDITAGAGGVAYSAALAYLIQGSVALSDPAWNWSGIGAAISLTSFKPGAGVAATRRPTRINFAGPTNHQDRNIFE